MKSVLSEIDAIVKKLANIYSSASISSGMGAEFEMWLVLKIAERLQKSSYNATLRNASDTRLTPGENFVLRGNPGRLGRGQACHVLFFWKTQPYEIHANTQFRGRSTETHEIDIAIIPQAIAAHLRAIGGGRPTGQPRVAIECKFKDSVGSKDEARQIVARQFDMHFLDGHPLPWKGTKHTIWPEASPNLGSGASKITYKNSFASCFNALCRLGGVTVPTGVFLSFNSVTVFSGLKPGTSKVNDFLNELELYLASQSP